MGLARLQMDSGALMQFCLACGELLIAGEPRCPNRYLSDHSEMFMGAVARSLQRLGQHRQPTPEQHRAALARVRKWWDKKPKRGRA